MICRLEIRTEDDVPPIAAGGGNVELRLEFEAPRTNRRLQVSRIVTGEALRASRSPGALADREWEVMFGQMLREAADAVGVFYLIPARVRGVRDRGRP